MGAMKEIDKIAFPVTPMPKTQKIPGSKSLSNLRALFDWESTQNISKDYKPIITDVHIWDVYNSKNYYKYGVRLMNKNEIGSTTTNVLLIGDSHMNQHVAEVDR
jgi:hypothetical protein